jgi:20S proteasome alpha/beta subunit
MIAPKPLLFPRPKPRLPQRLPERKRMTFIVGIACRDGMVLCADSFEGDGVNKRYVNKVECIESNTWGLAFGCSGSSPVINNFTAKLRDAFDVNRDYKRAEIEQEVEACLRHVNESYSTDEIEIVACVWTMEPIRETRLYRSHRGTHCLSPQANFACAGFDTSLANMALMAIIDDVNTIDDAIRLGVFSVALMKDKADGVDGPTNVLSYRAGHRSWEWCDEDTVERLERHLPLEVVYAAIANVWETLPLEFEPGGAYAEE